MYYNAVRQFIHTLKSLDAVLTKAERYAESRGFDVNNFCNARLAPDMLPFIAQIRIACDHAKSAASALARQSAPRHEDTETNFAELHGRIAKCIAYLEGFSASDFANTTEQTVIPLTFPKGKALPAPEFLWSRQIPNFYFHVCAAYAVLRQGGVDLGKLDYLGPLNLRDA